MNQYATFQKVEIGSFETIEAATNFLKAHGWYDYHAGNWHNYNRQGHIAEIRHPDQKRFSVVELIPPVPYPQDRIDSDGRTTCLWHRQHEWFVAHALPNWPHCQICGGICDPRLTAHALCQERAKRSLPITVLDSTPLCPCKACVTQRKADAGKVGAR